jgi:hypothetical protein
MLINIDKGFSNGDVVSLKLLNGDEIIARFESATDEVIKLSKPLAITVSPQGLGMIPWVFLGNDSDITLSKTHVFVMVASKKDAATQYRESTTGISLL